MNLREGRARKKWNLKVVIMNVIQVYLPITDYTDEEIENFYAERDNAMNQLKIHDINIIMGDINAKLECGIGQN